VNGKLLEKEIYPIESVIGADEHSYGGKSGKIVGLMSDIVQLVVEIVANQEKESCNNICPKA
tara:strand:- start:55 stop:240 length:186 start_codon:yes stop_codon:yes gene_type:complete